jgi:delta1-piperideine-2-carboxylate reductase
MFSFMFCFSDMNPTSLLRKSRLNLEAALVLADVVADAERDGCASHGLFRIPGYVHTLRHGNVDGKARPLLTDAAPGLLVVDACGGFALPAFVCARADLAAKARSQGIAALALRKSHHFSALWWEVEWLASQGLVALAFVNSAAFVAHSPESAHRVYGTNPMAFACPRGTGMAPLVFDQASAAMARGEIQLCLREGKTLPFGVAVDSNGSPTNDPAAALQGGAQLSRWGTNRGDHLRELT